MSVRQPSTALWYLHRLRAMDLDEVRHRFNELRLKRAGHRLSGAWPPSHHLPIFPMPHIGLSLLPGRSRVDLRATVANEASRVRQGHFAFLGETWRPPGAWPPPAEFWHTAPSEADAPEEAMAYCFDALRHGKAMGRDLKAIWELNRLQFLLPLAVDTALQRDAAGRALILDSIGAWMEANPPYVGLAWASGIELALRAISVAASMSILGAKRLSTGAHAMLRRFFTAHEMWLDRYPSLHSSQNNHRVAELAGLIVCGLTLGRPAAVVNDLIAELDECLTGQFLRDGIGAEQSPTYAAFSVELGLIAFAFAGVVPSLISPALRDRLAAWAGHIGWMMDAAGRVPQIGDNDAGRGLMLTQQQEPHYVASVTAALAAWLNRPDLSPPVLPPHLRDGLFGSRAGVGPAKSGLSTWPEGGYSVFRGEDAAFVLVFDHGPLGHLTTAAHGHADALSVWLTIGEQPVLVDVGTATYRPDDARRDRMRETGAHNTLEMGGQSSSRIVGPFNWSPKAQAQGRRIGATTVSASHDGYLKAFGVAHHRRVEQAGQFRFRIVDALKGTAGKPLPVSLRWVIAPTCSVLPAGTNRWVIQSGERPILFLQTEGPLQTRLIGRADVDAVDYAAAFGASDRIASLKSEGVLAPDQEQVTTLTILPHLHRSGSDIAEHVDLRA